MAWKLDKKHNTGSIITHWEIEKVFVRVDENTVEISYNGWISKEEKMAGSAPVVTDSYLITQDLSLKVTKDFLALCETMVRNNKFVGSINA